jgi:hypothetical protein
MNESEEQQARLIEYGISFITTSIARAQDYSEKRKHHTSLLIMQGIISNLKPANDLTRYRSVFTKTQRQTLWDLLQRVPPLLKQQFRRSDDIAAAQQALAEFDTLVNEWKFPEDCSSGSVEEQSDDTECSCDDCHNHTCSTYGPLGGCRKDRSRD